MIIIDCPFIIKNGLKDQKVVLNSDVILDIEIISSFSEPFKFKWKKNGEPIDIDSNNDKYEYIIENNVYKLIVKSFESDDVADYEIYLAEPDDFDFTSKAKIEIDLSIGN